MVMHRVFVGLTVLGLALGPLLGCAAATAGHPSAGAPPPPGRVLAQSIDDPVARHTAIRLGPHNPTEVLELNIGLSVDAPPGATGPITTGARSVGFTVTVITPDQLIAVTASVARVERVLRVRLDDYRLPGPGGYTFLANDRPPTVPAALTSIQAISGLSNSGLSTYHRAITGPAPRLRPRSSPAHGDRSSPTRTHCPPTHKRRRLTAPRATSAPRTRSGDRRAPSPAARRRRRRRADGPLTPWRAGA